MSSSRADPNPYYIAPGRAEPRRILLICYHAPPSNAVGALRWTMMARHFAAHGWGFDVFAGEPATLTTRNDALLGHLPSGTRLYGIPRVKPRLDQFVDRLVLARRKLRAFDANRVDAVQPAPSTQPGRESGVGRRLLNAFHAWREYVEEGDWAHRAAAAGRAVFDPELHHWVISSGPPHMSHEGGRQLSEWTGLPLLTDFRDGWRFQEWVPLGGNWRRLAAKHEARAVRRSSIVVANSEPVRAIMQRAYPQRRVITVTNGVDDEVFPPARQGDKFIIGSPGTIYVGRDPTPIFEAMARLVRCRELAPTDIGLEFMGHSGPATEAWLRQLAAERQLEGFLTIRPGGPRQEALGFMASCSVLVALQQGTDLAIPAKIFEYMKFPAWLLVISARGSATDELLSGTAAAVLDPMDSEGIYSALEDRYLAFKAGGRPSALATEERFSRRFQAEMLLNEIESSRPPPAS